MSSQANAPFAASQEVDDAYKKSVKEAESVWFCGYFTGRSFLAPPFKLSLEEQFADAQLNQVSYTVPRGYTYRTSDVPPILQDSPPEGSSLLLGLKIYTFLMLASFVFFLVAACPVPWGGEKNSATQKIKWTVWSITDKDVGTENDALSSIDVVSQYLRCGAACTVVATIFSFCCALAGWFKWRKGFSFISYYLLLVLSFLALMWGICGNGVMIHFYSANLVGAPLKDYSKLSVGFYFSLFGWIFTLCSFGVLVFVTHFNVWPCLKKVRTFDAAYFLLLFVALLFTVVGTTQPLFQRHFSESDAVADSVAVVDWVKVGYWREEVSGRFAVGSVLSEDSTSISIIMGPEDYRCSKYRQVLSAGSAFIILAAIALSFATMLSILAYFKAGFRLASCILAGVAAVFLLVTWAITIALLKSSYCKNSVDGSIFAPYPGAPSGFDEGLLEFPKYQMSGGFALPFVAWCLTVLALVGNIVIPWPIDRKHAFKKHE